MAAVSPVASDSWTMRMRGRGLGMGRASLTSLSILSIFSVSRGKGTFFKVAKTRPYNQDCPIARTLDIVGDRWTLLIIRDLFLGKSRFSEFRDSSPAIPPRLLSARLKRLEEQGLIDRLV